jgi:glycerol-3-phosphate dehydrogenase (NAD(P)+)
MQVASVGVIGAGAWGTALAIVAARAGLPVHLWARNSGAVTALAASHENVARLPGIVLTDAIVPTADIAGLSGCDCILIATPAQAMRKVMTTFAPHLASGTRAVITAKGIEQTTGCFMVDVLAEVAPHLEPLVLSGPSFAADVARGLPTAVTLAARSLDTARPVAEALSLPTFRPYLSDDLAGVQVGGAVKNVLAIACGIVAGRGLGESARAALIARSFAELTRFGRSLGARTETLTGLSGLGDLVLTCSSSQSRNYNFGVALGQGRSATQAREGQRGVSEGAFTAAAVAAIAGRHGIDMPISAAVLEIIEGRASVETVIEQLMQRPLKAED